MDGAQLKAILWLRWRLTRNQLRRLGKVNAVVTQVFFWAAWLAAAAGGIAGFFVGAGPLAELVVRPGQEVGSGALVMLPLWDAIVFVFLLFWTVGVLTEIQRSESIDLARLLHLPVSLRQVFGLNYAISHFTLSLIVTLPAMFGLVLGFAVRLGPRLLLLGALVLAFVLAITAWSYCLRGWLAGLMTNPRRRRAVLVGITMTVILGAQLPNLLLNSPWGRKKLNLPNRHATPPAPPSSHAAPSAPTPRPAQRGIPPEAWERIARAHLWIPLGWPAYGAKTLVEGRLGPTVAATLVCGLICCWGLLRAYHITLRSYTSADPGSPTPRTTTARARPPARPRIIHWRLPFVADEVSALAFACLRSLLRAPEVKMMLFMPVLFLLIFGSLVFSSNRQMPPAVLQAFTGTGLVCFVLFSSTQVLTNQFGFDRDAFRVLVLLPTPRRRILLGKNLAFAPIIGGVGLLALAVAGVALRLAPLHLLSSACQLAAGFLLCTLIGSFFSMLAPYRFGAGSLKPTKLSATTTFQVFLGSLASWAVLVPLAIPGGAQLLQASLGWLPWLPVHLLLSILLLAAAWALYLAALPALGRMLDQREQAILQAVTQEIE